MQNRYPTLSRLRALRAVGTTGSFSAAAECLLLTQPAVSTQIKQLEQETGVQLVERIGKRAKPTPEGEVLIASADRIFEELDTALEQLGQMQGETSGPLHIGAGATAATHLLPTLLADLERDHPKVRIRVTTGNTPELLSMLKSAGLDVAILTAPIGEEEISQSHFYEDQLVCLVPTGEIRRKAALRPADFVDKRLVLYEPGGYIRQIVDNWFASADCRPRDVLDLGNADAQANFVRAGFGWSIISRMAAEPESARGGLRIVPLDPPISRKLVTAWRTNRADRPAIAASIRLFGGFPGQTSD